MLLLILCFCIPHTDGFGFRKRGELQFKLQQKAILASLQNRIFDNSTDELGDHDIVKYVNSKQKFWTAEVHPRFVSYSDEVRSGLMGVDYIKLPLHAKKALSPTRSLNITIPETFDAREWWTECTERISRVEDQSSCGSCWAMSAAEAFSDRLCIASKGKLQVDISVSDVLACCKDCGKGCKGGFPLQAWQYFMDHGIVTGSEFQTEHGCKPYPFPPCHQTMQIDGGDACKKKIYTTPECKRECSTSKYDKSYTEDKLYAQSAYGVAETEEAIQKEILTHGPVQVSFEVFKDFLHYKKGVYVRTAGISIGGHAAKLLGWGVEEGVPYWLMANSWGPDWGENVFCFTEQKTAGFQVSFEVFKDVLHYKKGVYVVSFEVFKDFLHYKKGVYVRTAGISIGGHAAKLLGWGVEEGVPYWLMANSWGPDWGENGFFKIARGIKECGVEEAVVAGIPRNV